MEHPPSLPEQPDSRPAEGTDGGSGLRGRIGGWLGAPGSQRRVLARNAIWNWGGFLLNAVIVFFLTPFIIHQLGNTSYAIWAIVMTLTGYFGFADFGVRPAIVHFIAKHDALEAIGEVNRYVNTAFVTLVAGAVGILAASVGAAYVLPELFHVPGALQAEAGWAVLITGATIAVTLPLNAFSAVLVGKQRFDVTCRIDLFQTVVRTAGVVFALVQGYGLVGLALANAAAEIVEMVWKTSAAFRTEPGLRFRPRTADWSGARGLLVYGGLNIFVAVAFQLTYETDAWVIGLALALPAVAYFAPAAKLATYARSMLWSVGRILTPAIGALEAREGRRSPEIRKLLTASARNLLLFAGPVLVYLAIMGGPFLERWLGTGDEAWAGIDSFRAHATVPLLILALGAAAPIASYPLVAAHYGTNRMRSLALFSALEGAGNLALSLALVGSYGLVGVALGTAIPGFIVHFVVMPWFICREFDMHVGRFTLQVWAAPLVAGAVAAGVMLLLFDPHASYGWAVLIGSGAGLTVLYYGVAFGVQRWWRRAATRSDLRGPEARSAEASG